MARTLLVTAGTPLVTTANSTSYYSLGAGASLDTISGTESIRQIVHRTPGTLSKLYVRITANTIAGNSTINVRNNAANTSMTLTIDANATGVFEDTTHEVTIAAGDKLAYRFVPGAATGTVSIAVLSVIFNATTNTVSRMVCGGAGAAYATASVSRYNVLAGEMSAAVGVEASAKTRIRKPCVGKNLAINVVVNARVNDTTVRMRKNGANGAMSIVVPAGQIGWFEDTINQDTLAAGDDYNSVVETLTGTESMTIRSICVDLETTNSQGTLVTGRTGALIQAANVTNYLAISGALVAGPTEADRKLKARDDFTVSELTAVVSANTVSAESTLKLRKNGVDTSLVVTISANTAGVYSDSTHTETILPTDDINLVLITGATGTSLVVRAVSINSGLTIVEEVAAGGAIGRRQGRSPLYRSTKPKTVAVIIRLKVQLQYEVTKLTIIIGLPYHNVFEKPKPKIKFASAIITPILNILPLRQRPTPKPVIRSITTQVGYQVQSIQLKSACAYEVDKLITGEQQTRLRTIATNFLLSDI